MDLAESSYTDEESFVVVGGDGDSVDTSRPVWSGGGSGQTPRIPRGMVPDVYEMTVRQQTTDPTETNSTVMDSIAVINQGGESPDTSHQTPAMSSDEYEKALWQTAPGRESSDPSRQTPAMSPDEYEKALWQTAPDRESSDTSRQMSAMSRDEYERSLWQAGPKSKPDEVAPPSSLFPPSVSFIAEQSTTTSPSARAGTGQEARSGATPPPSTSFAQSFSLVASVSQRVPPNQPHSDVFDRGDWVAGRSSSASFAQAAPGPPPQATVAEPGSQASAVATERPTSDDCGLGVSPDLRLAEDTKDEIQKRGLAEENQVRKETITVPGGEVELLEKAKFDKKIQGQYPGLEVSFDMGSCRVIMMGADQELQKASELIAERRGTIICLRLPYDQFPCTEAAGLLKSASVTRVIRDACLKENPSGVVRFKDNCFFVYAFDRQQALQMQKAGLEKIQRKELNVGEDPRLMSSGPVFEALRDLETRHGEQTSIDRPHPSQLVLVSVHPDFSRDVKHLETVLEENIRRPTTFHMDAHHLHLLQLRLNNGMPYGSLRQDRVQIDLDSSTITTTCTIKEREEDENSIARFSSQVVTDTLDFTEPSFKEFIASQQGERELRKVEIETKCVMRVDNLDAGGAQGGHPLEMGRGSLEAAVTESVAPQHTRPDPAAQAVANRIPQKPRLTVRNTSDIAHAEHDVLVNSSNVDLNLNLGQVSKDLVRVGGKKLQDDCRGRYPKGIKVGDVAVTGPGRTESDAMKDGKPRLKCKKVYHCCLPETKGPITMKKVVKEAVTKCLALADRDKMTSIGFPALGTGTLKYPAALVAEVMYDAALEYGRNNPGSQVADVCFIVHQKDTETIQAFLREEDRYKANLAETDQGQRDPGASANAGQVPPEKPRVIFRNMNDMTNAQHDVLVNSTNTGLNLKLGQISKEILRVGGEKLQVDCRAKYPKGIKMGEVAVTGPGRTESDALKDGKLRLQCKKVYHCCLPWSKNAAAITTAVKDAVTKCLTLADRDEMKSIGFPALGTGTLEYPVSRVAEAMYEAALEYGRNNPGSHIAEVYFIALNKDEETVQTFKLVDAKYRAELANRDQAQKAAKNSMPLKRECQMQWQYFESTQGRVVLRAHALGREDIQSARAELLKAYNKQLDVRRERVNGLADWDQSFIQRVVTACKAENIDVTFNFNLGRLELRGLRTNLDRLQLSGIIRDAQA